MFLIYINDLHVAIKYSEVLYFADDTSLLNFNSCAKSINKQVSYDLKHLVKGKQISVNVGRTKLVLFTLPKKQLGCDLKMKLIVKRPYETNSQG